MRWWKILGLAGVVGVAATGAVVVRTERRRRSYTPEEIKERLHSRLAEASEDTSADAQPAPRKNKRRGLARILPARKQN